MYVFISKKLSFLIFLCTNIAVLGLIFLLNYALEGPKLGRLYDLLLGFRQYNPATASLVSDEILVIAAEEFVEPSDIYTVLLSLSENQATDLLIEVPVLGTGSGKVDDRDELSNRLNREFSILTRNIRSLFEAIRYGYISPQDSPYFVDSLVNLSEKGKERLITAIWQEEIGLAQAAQAAAVFGRVTMAGDSQPDDLHSYQSSESVIRRIAPVLSDSGSEHIAYNALKYRWKESIIDFEGIAAESPEQKPAAFLLKAYNFLTGTKPYLVNRFDHQGVEAENRFWLDRKGSILIEKAESFRHIEIGRFREYDSADKAMARLIKNAQDLGVYADVLPEQMPVILYDYAETLKNDMLRDPNEQNCTNWIMARSQYIDSLDNFLYGPYEMTLVNGFEELIAWEELGEGGVARLQGMRDELIRAFVTMRDKHRELTALRDLIARTVNSSFCIMSPGTDNATIQLANTLLTGRSITPGNRLYVILCSFLVSLILFICINRIKPLMQLLVGLGAVLFCMFAFGLFFVISAYWINPVIPAAACLYGTLILVVTRFLVGYKRELRYHCAYGPAVSDEMFEKLVKKGRPELSETVCAHAAIIAIKNLKLSVSEDKGNPVDAVKEAAGFRKAVYETFSNAGAFVFGFSGDTAFACFGSPAERICNEHIINPSDRAVSYLRNIINEPAFVDWHFGIESGKCAFSWSEETGCIVNGHAALRARLFTSLTARFKVKAIVGETVKREACLAASKIASLSGESFYEFY